MKKIMAILLCLATALTMSLTAFAETELSSSPVNDIPEGQYTIDVTGKYAEGGNSGNEISVDISWESMEFTYTGSKSSYDTDTHKTTVIPGGWSDEQKTITVTNHSNTAVDITFVFTSEISGMDGSFTENRLTLESAESEEYQTVGDNGKCPAPTGATKFSLDTESPAIGEDTDIGTITVSITASAV